ncbi:McrB family protein [Haloplanus natans]|uniref:McrB family protein n=1 Tax=Haloplanus natans TaxID=376171 RepID=UPI0006776C31|nr:AAA family ATPase [Haloplanus natans]
MHSTLRIRDYVFDTSALRGAVETIDLNEASVEEGYSEDAVYALFDYFCDWGPVRESDINVSVSEELASVSGGEREALFNDCCDRLAENLRGQYSMGTDAESIARVASILASDKPVTGKYDFLLRHLWQFSKHLAEFDPKENQAISGVQEFLNATRNLPQEFLQAKESQYAGSVKVNKIRYRLLKKFHVDGKIDVSVLDNIKTEVKQEDGESILQNWRDYTILGQIYYDYFKPRLDHYLQTLANRIVDEFSELELTTHIVNFQGAQSYLNDFAWIAAHTPPSRSQKDKYQLYLGIHASHLRYGLHVGSNLREGDWETGRDLDQVEDPSTIRFEEVVDKLRSVERDFRRLEGLEMGEGDEEIEIERPSQADEIARQLNTKKQVVFYGPPGTGKTFVAQQFAHWWTAEQDVDTTTGKRVRTVTFHPSFTYEDFVEGLSAEATEEGNVAYEVQDGILKQICKAARADYQQTPEGEEPLRYVLIIDEINRGNLAQIFGETITLFEADKRGVVSTQLAHSGQEFTIPPNLYVIGTMNTADRSIALVDAALRRRFRFIACPPEFDKIIEEYDLPADPLQESDGFESLLWLSIVALREMNDRIVRSADLGKGKQIGHTRLFGVETIDDIRDVWRFDILPLLEEYYFGQFDRIQQELFDSAGGELFDWERKQIRDFTVQDLSDALAAFADGDVEMTYTELNTNSSTNSRKRWDQESFFEEVKSSFDQEVVDVYRDFYEFGTVEADVVGYGSGNQIGAVQFYWDEYHQGDYLVYELRTDGTLQFRFWGRQDYDPELFEGIVHDINPLLDEPIDVEYVMSDEFTRLQIPIERLQGDEDRELVKEAIRDFVQNCATRSL